jgi:hypothetical protein
MGDFEVTSSSNDVLVSVDLSPIEAPPGCKFHSVDLEFDRIVKMRGVELLCPPQFRIQLQDVQFRIAAFHA